METYFFICHSAIENVAPSQEECCRCSGCKQAVHEVTSCHFKSNLNFKAYWMGVIHFSAINEISGFSFFERMTETQTSLLHEFLELLNNYRRPDGNLVGVGGGGACHRHLRPREDD